MMDTTWEDQLDCILADLRSLLVAKHHDYGDENLRTFGELGMIVRASDKVARLKNLIDKSPSVTDEDRTKTWQDLAGYAIQALIHYRVAPPDDAALFEKRRRRLILGICPDCGTGALIRQSYRADAVMNLFCSDDCGFEAEYDHWSLEDGYETMDEILRAIARQPARIQQV